MTAREKKFLCLSAVIAADDLREAYPDRKIYVVDSLSASLGQGLLVRGRRGQYVRLPLHQAIRPVAHGL